MIGHRSFTWRLLAFFVFTLALVAWALQALGAFSLAGSYRVHAQFADVSGLLVGSEVLLAGVPVGRVERITLDAQHHPRVTLAIHSDVQLDPTVRAAVRARSVLGEKAIALSPAPPTGTPLADGDELVNTEVEADLLSLASEAGQTMRTISQAVGEFGDIAEALGTLRESLDVKQVTDDLHSVGELARSAGDFLSRNESGFTATLDAARAGAEALQQTAVRAQQPIEQLDALLAELQQRGTVADADALVESCRIFAEEAGPELVDTVRTFRRALGGDGATPGLTADLQRVTSGAEKFFGEASELTREMKRISDKLDSTIEDLGDALENVGKFTPREIRKILQDEGVKVLLLQ